jgi:hypothetical protein
LNAYLALEGRHFTLLDAEQSQMMETSDASCEAEQAMVKAWGAAEAGGRELGEGRAAEADTVTAA